MDPSKPLDDELAAAYRRELSEEPWPGRDCPPTEALERLLLDEAEGGERQGLLDHLATCAGCADLVRDLRSLEDWSHRAAAARGGGAVPAARMDRRRPHAWRAWPLALAASLLVALGAAFLWRQTAGGPPPGDALRGARQAVTPSSGTELAAAPEGFAWPAQRGATGYRVRVFDEEGEAVWASDWLTAASSAVPTAVPWTPGGSYTWTVAVRGDVPRSRLGPFTFRIGAAPAP